MTSVLGFADLILNFFDQIGPDQLRDYLEGIRSEALALEKLLNGMLRLFSIDSGSENWHWQEVEVAGLLDQVLQGYEEPILSKDLVLDIRTGERSLAVWADVEKLTLLLGNLVDNAVKFNQPGGRLVVRAEPRVVDDASMIYLGVGNDGETIPREAADEVFEAYAQLGDLDSGKPSGVGIGLATCRAILRQMHGRIFWEDRVEAGTWFGLLLPTRSAYEEIQDVRHHD